MHRKYGASLRDLFLFANAPAEYDNLVESQLATLSLENMYHLLRGTIEPSDNSHLLISTGPSEDDRGTAERKLASHYLLERICERVFGGRIREVTNLRETLRIQ